jgi:phosphoglycolate/pyridoxal phosphate phosphatase family enzyme
MLFVFDLDGVIYRGNQPAPCAAQTVAEIRKSGHLVFFLTNNSAKTRIQYAQKLAEMQIKASPEEIMTSAYATALYLKENGFDGATAFVIGEEGLFAELSPIGVAFAEPSEDCRADVVVVGIDRSINYLKLKSAQQAILHGARFIATNRDATYPLENGRVEPGAGSIVAAVEVASGVSPIVIGKPETYSLEKILGLTGSKPEETVVVGDRIDTDVAMGKTAGVKTVLTLTGVTSREDILELPPHLMPNLVLENLCHLIQALC